MIERASSKDLNEILEVINTSNREAFSKIVPKEYFKSPILTLEELKRDFEVMEFYVYRLNGRIVGVAALQVESESTGRIRWVYILPEFQRRGIGTALIKHIEFRARELKLRKLWLVTPEKAYWAINFYRKLNYEVTSKIERAWGFDVVMEKELKQTTYYW